MQVSLRSRDAKQDIRVNSFALDLRQPIGPRPSRSPTLHHSIASLAAGFVVGSRVDWTPRLDAIFAPPLALRTTGNQYRLVATADYRPSRSLSMAGSDRVSRWIMNLQERRHTNVAVVAMANKMTRMAWAIMSKGVDYDPNFGTGTASAT